MTADLRITVMKQIELDWVEIREEKKGVRLSLKDRCVFFSTFARLLQGGVPILRALEILSRETRKENVRGLISKIGSHIREGKSLSYCLSIYPAVFPSYQISLVQAGEVSGQMDKVLADIALELEKEEETRSKIREAISYPAFIVIFGLITIFILTTSIIPKLAVVYQDFGEKLPWMTLLVIQISQWIKFIIPLFLLVSAVSFLLLKRYQNRFYSIALRIPLFGSMLQNSLLIRLSYLLSLLLKSGIPLLRALEVTGQTFQNSFFKNHAKKAAEKIAQGESLAESLRGLPFVSETALALILSGEESGSLSEALEEISKIYSRELETATRMILKLLEPALILVIGVMTGFVVIAMIFPIVTLSAVVR